MKVSIVIPNYNGKHFMDDCMSSLAKQTMRDFEVIVVDNGSSDGSVEEFREKYSGIRLIELAENTGFSGAVNRGIEAAKAPYVLLLNNDTVSFPDFIEQMYRAIQRDKRIFSVSSKMIQLHDHDKMDSAGDLYTIIGWAVNRGAGRPVNQYSKSAPIFTACAGAAIYRKSMFEEIGYFDEHFFAYREDTDVGYRALIHGYRNVYCPRAKVYHVGSGTSGSKHNSFKVKLGVRNNIYLNYKNMPLPFLVVNLPFLLAGYVGKGLYFLRKGYFREYWKGITEAFANLGQIDKTRFQWKHLGNYLRIEGALILNTFRMLDKRM